MIMVEGPKGKLSYKTSHDVAVAVVDGKLIVSLVAGDSAPPTPQARADFGTVRSHLNNMVKGVSTGWKKSLEMNGVGFVAKVNGPKLVVSVGFSHDCIFEIPQSVKCVVTKNVIDVESADKEALGTFAAKVRAVHPPEPYLGKGIKYSDEIVRRKAGKTGKK
jgi:large subunit ribosomal protein L6